MDLADVQSKVKEILVRELELDYDSIGEETTIDNTPLWDSVKHVDIFFSLQDTFGLEFLYEETEEMISYPAIVDVIMKKLQAGDSGREAPAEG